MSPSIKSQSILPASCTNSCFMSMIWSSRARNRSPDPVVSCCFGRIVSSDAATESCLPIRGNRENQIAGFRGPRPQNLAISNPPIRRNTTLAQQLRNCSRSTINGGRGQLHAFSGAITKSRGRAHSTSSIGHDHPVFQIFLTTHLMRNGTLRVEVHREGETHLTRYSSPVTKKSN